MSDTITLHVLQGYFEEVQVSLVTVEVDIEHGRLTARQPDLLPETGVGLLTVLSSSDGGHSPRVHVALPLIRCQPGTRVSPTARRSYFDDSLLGISLVDANVWLAIAVNAHVVTHQATIGLMHSRMATVPFAE